MQSPKTNSSEQRCCEKKCSQAKDCKRTCVRKQLLHHCQISQLLGTLPVAHDLGGYPHSARGASCRPRLYPGSMVWATLHSPRIASELSETQEEHGIASLHRLVRLLPKPYCPFDSLQCFNDSLVAHNKSFRWDPPPSLPSLSTGLIRTLLSPWGLYGCRCATILP